MIVSEIFNGSNFESETVKKILESAFLRSCDESVLDSKKCYTRNGKPMQRLRLFYGKDGKIWNESHEVCGYIGRSTGAQKIAILINKKNSFGGSQILTDRIVGIYDTKTKKCLYWDENYTMPQAEIAPIYLKSASMDDRYNFRVFINGTLFANCKTEKQAQKLADFMTAKRFSK